MTFAYQGDPRITYAMIPSSRLRAMLQPEVIEPSRRLNYSDCIKRLHKNLGGTHSISLYPWAVKEN